MTRTDFIAAARGMLKTKFLHQGRLPGAGLDCAGLVVCAARACGYSVKDQAGYGRIPYNGQFVAAVKEHCDVVPLNEVLPGDLMLFAYREGEQHIAIVTTNEPVMLIHAYSDVGEVVENGFDPLWQSRYRGCYRLRGIE